MLKEWLAIVLAVLLVVQASSEETQCPQICTCKDHINAVIMRCATLSIDNQAKVPVSHFVIIESETPLSMGEYAFGKIGLKGVNSITISNSSIMSIDKDAFKNLTRLTDVKITHTNLSFIHPEVFQHNSNLKKLNLAFNPLAVNNDSFIKSTSVEELDMSNCNLRDIGTNTFKDLSQLTLLDLSKNNIQNLIVGTFDSLININEIRLSHNRITHLPDGILKNDGLQNLYLDHNPIVSFNGDMFSKLVSLSLSSCKLTKIEDGMFDKMIEMTNLDLSNNQIKSIGKRSFSKMVNLNTINLSGNQFKNLDENVFENNFHLAKITLDDNKQLTQLPADGFKMNSTSNFIIYYFSCQNCGLHSVSSKTFQTMPAMAFLKLSHNFISDIRNEVFHDMKALTEMDLSYNEISTMDSETFKNNINLHTLNLAGNPIKSLHPTIFKHNLNLLDLDLSNCGLFQLWSSPKQYKLSSIQNLNVSNNRITLIKKEDMAVTDQLKSLDISGNKLHCSEDYIELMKYLTDHKIQDSQYLTHEEMTYDTKGDMVLWKNQAHEKCPSLKYEIYQELDESHDSEDYGVTDETNDMSNYSQDSEYEDTDPVPMSKIPITRELGLSNQVYDDDLDATIYLPTTLDIKYSSMWPILVFLGTALAILGIAVNIILFVIRRRQVTRPLNIKNMSKMKKNSGLVYQQLSEERDGSKTPIFSRYAPIATVHQNSYAPEHV